jgi:tetratricopeptide (TPR) repeat protein
MAAHLISRGDTLLASGDSLGALESWQQARGLATSPELEARIHRAEFQRCMQQGLSLYHAQQMAEASFQFKKALSFDPNNEEALRYLHYSQGGDTQVASRFEHLE